MMARTVLRTGRVPSTCVILCVLLAHGPAVVAQSATRLELPLRSIHAAGNWGTNESVAADWEADRSNPLVPADYLALLRRVHVKWIGLSVALTYDDSMDSTIERNTEYVSSDGASFSDDALRQMIREFRSQGIEVYLTLAFEAHAAASAERPVRRWQLGDPGDVDGGPCCDSGILPQYWPWRPDHLDHERFVAEFWETYTRQAVHVATLAEEEGVRMYSLGTETDRLFRTRSGGYFVNDFGEELRSMVERVRAVYTGLSTYDMHYQVLLDPGFHGPGSDQLWNDLDLDVVGVSAWFPLAETPPSTVTSVEEAQARYEQIIGDYLVPLADRNPGRPVLFLEYGAMDLVETPAAPGDSAGFPPFVFDDANGNGIDDGRETQANLYPGLLDAMDSHPGVLNGVFWWDNWIASEERWAGYWAGRRTFAVRDKPSEEILQAAYARTAGNRPPQAVGAIPPQSVTVGGPVPLLLNVRAYFRDPEDERLTYVARSSESGVVGVSVTGAVLEITATAVGEATVAVTASDGQGWATQTVGITSCAPANGCPSPLTGFTDDPIRPGSTPVRAVHFLELRTRIDALRTREGLRAFGWTDPNLTPNVTAVRRVHLTELRAALAEAYRAASLPAPAYTEGW